MSGIDIEKSKIEIDRYKFEMEKQNLANRVLTLYYEYFGILKN